MAAIAAIALASFELGSIGRDEKKDLNKGWVDYDNLKQVDRLKERPGNYAVLGAISEFFDGLYSIRPDFSRCVYPFQIGNQLIKDWDEAQGSMDEEAKGSTPPRNKWRSYNIVVRSLTTHSAESFDQTAEFKKLPKDRQDRFGEVHKRHRGRAVVALVKVDLESLRSSKVEGGDPFVFYLIRGKDRWQVAWFEWP
jgi:hypothetical protein